MSRITNNFPNHLSIGWELTSTCNYSCWYCPDYLHNGKYKWPDLNKSLEFFNNICNQKELVYMTMVGGEPTLWPELVEFLKNKPTNLKVEIATNGSRTLNWWSKNAQYLEMVVISFHPNTADPDHVFNVCKLLCEKNVSKVFVWILAVKEKAHVCDTLFNRLKDSDLPVDVVTKPLYNIFGVNKEQQIAANNEDFYVKNILTNNKFFRGLFNTSSVKPTKAYLDGVQFDYLMASVNNLNDFKGWTCTAGINRLFIHKDGSINRGSCGVGGVVGNINDGYLPILDPVICDSVKTCRCIDEIKLEKWKD